jgi:hypothetical protein
MLEVALSEREGEAVSEIYKENKKAQGTISRSTSTTVVDSPFCRYTCSNSTLRHRWAEIDKRSSISGT